MLVEESLWIKDVLTNVIDLSYVDSVVDIGSSTRHYRTVSQPFIDKNIFEPLRAKKIKICHLDSKKEKGVDIVADLKNLDQITLKFDLAIATNLLEHVESPGKVLNSIGKILKPMGYLVITVPYQFVYHPDPIDTMFRPTNIELEKLASDFIVLSSEILNIKKIYVKPRLARVKNFAADVLSLRKQPFDDLPLLFKKFKVSCVALRKIC